ncbi:MAG: dihydrodipicolinate synthase family protein [Anaerolineales bacterium]
MTGVRLSLRGIYAPVPTAFGDDEALQPGKLAQNVRRWNEEPLAGYVVGGSNGEFPLLTRAERLEVLRVVAGERSPGRTMIGGASMESTGASAEMAVAVAEAGADAVIVVTPWYYKGRMTAAALVAHYVRVADASPVPVLLYNMPAHTGVDIPIAAVAELSAHPNIAGIKESLPDAVKMGRMIRQCRSGFHVLAGSAGSLLPGLAVGAVGGVLALANIAARPLDRLMESFGRGDLAAARTAQLDLIELNALVTERHGVAGLKAAMDMLGYYGGPVRGPLMGVSPAEREEIRGALAEAGLLARA